VATDEEAEQRAIETATAEVIHREGELSGARLEYLARSTLAATRLTYGSPATVHAGLAAVAGELGADELMLVPYDLTGAGRSRTLRLAAQALSHVRR
jgi:hypothetical protein